MGEDARPTVSCIGLGPAGWACRAGPPLGPNSGGGGSVRAHHETSSGAGYAKAARTADDVEAPWERPARCRARREGTDQALPSRRCRSGDHGPAALTGSSSQDSWASEIPESPDERQVRAGSPLGDVQRLRHHRRAGHPCPLTPDRRGAQYYLHSIPNTVAHVAPGSGGLSGRGGCRNSPHPTD